MPFEPDEPLDPDERDDPYAWPASHEEPNDAEPDADADDPGEMVLPEMDLTEQAPPAAPPAESLRLRAPAVAGKAPAANPPPLSPQAPAPSPKDMDWKQLGDALWNAELAAKGSRDAEHLFANAANPGDYRERADYSAGPKLAMAPVEMNAQRQASEGREMGLQRQRSEIGVKAAMDDPNSLQSQKARDAVKAMGIKLPAGFDNFSASDIQRFVKTGELARLEEARARNEAAKTAAAAKEKAAKEKAAKEAATLESSRKNYAKELKALGVDPATASQKDIDRAISIGHNKATEAMAASNNAIARQAESRHAGDYAALSQGVPFAGGELRYTGSGTPRAEDVNEVQKISASYGAAIADMDDLAPKIEAFAKNPSPATKDAMMSAARITGGHLNTAFGQGAMSQDEAAAMADVLGSNVKSAAGVQAFFDKLMGSDPQAAAALGRKLKSARESTRAAALGKTRAYRFDMGGGQAGGPVKMRFPDGSTHDVPPEKMEKARMKGGVPVSG